MYNMIKPLIILLIISPLVLVGQQLKCCESDKQVENHLTGNWKKTDGDPKIVYHYWFKDGQGNMERLQQPKKGVIDVIEDDNHSFVDVIKSDNGYKLEFTYPYGNHIAVLKYLSESKLILISDGKETEFYKVEN